MEDGVGGDEDRAEVAGVAAEQEAGEGVDDVIIPARHRLFFWRENVGEAERRGFMSGDFELINIKKLGSF